MSADPAAPFGDLLGRTTHVDVDDVGALGLGDAGSFCHPSASQPASCTTRMLIPKPLAANAGLAFAPDQACTGCHFRNDQPCTKPFG